MIMPERRSPLFLERKSYRRRRLMDAARVLPVLGFVLILLPVLWTHDGQMGTAGEALYLFALWLALIVAAAALARPLRAALERDPSRPSADASAPIVPPAAADGNDI